MSPFILNAIEFLYNEIAFRHLVFHSYREAYKVRVRKKINTLSTGISKLRSPLHGCYDYHSLCHTFALAGDCDEIDIVSSSCCKSCKLVSESEREHQSNFWINNLIFETLVNEQKLIDHCTIWNIDGKRKLYLWLFALQKLQNVARI